jgi:hypothetical protein
VLDNLLCLWIVNFLGLAAPEWFFSHRISTSLTNILSLLFSAFKIFCCIRTHTWYLEVIIYFSIGIKAGTLRLKDLIPECDHYLFVTSIF